MDGDLEVGGDIYLPLNGKIYSPFADGTDREIMNAGTTSDNLSIGYGLYAASKGNLNLYGNIVAFHARDRRLLMVDGGNYLNDFTTGTATINATYLSGGNIYFYKLNGIVFCMWAELTPKVTASRTSVATIPVEFRPYATAYAMHTTIATEEYILAYNNGNFYMNKLTNGSKRWGSTCWVAARDAANAG